MKIEDLELKKLELITDYEKVKEIVKDAFSSKRMIDFLYKNYYFFKIDNHRFLEIRKFNSFEISKTIWYNDETEAPEKTLTNFIIQQTWDFKKFNDKEKNFYTLVQNYDETPLLFTLNIFNSDSSYGRIYDNQQLYKNKKVKIETLNYEWKAPYQLDEKQDTDNNLIHDIEAIINLNNKNMLERLKKYYNRYNDQIYVDGYWANR